MSSSSAADLRIFVISLRRRQDRRAHMQALLARLGLRAEFVDAVDGSALTADQCALYDRRKALAVYGEEMTPAEIGCHLSHLSIYRRIVEEKIAVALVLEDDVDCDADLPRLLSSAVSDLRSRWLVLRLQSTKTCVIDANRAETQGETESIVRGRTIARLRTGVLGGCGYLIKHEGAKAMLRYAAKPFMPIDQTMDRYWENDIIPYVMRPFPIRQNPHIASDIGVRKTIRNRGAYLTALRRSRRAFDGLNKRRFQFVHMGGWRRAAQALSVRRLAPMVAATIQGWQSRLNAAQQFDG